MSSPDRDPWHDGDQTEPIADSGTPLATDEPAERREGKLRRLLGATPMVMTMLVLLLVLFAVLSWHATRWKQQVTVNRVVLEGTVLLSPLELEKKLGRFKGMNLDEVRIDEVMSAIASEPYIREMLVGKELNGILRVRIEERRPAAMLVEGDRKMIIDTEGIILPDSGVSGRMHRLVPVYIERAAATAMVSGERRIDDRERSLLFALLDAFSGSAHAGIMLSGIHLLPHNESWFSVTGSPIRFVIGNDGNFKEKLKKFEIFWQKVVAKKGIDCYESVDLRFRNRVFAREPEPVVEAVLPLDLPVAPDSSQHSDEHH